MEVSIVMGVPLYRWMFFVNGKIPSFDSWMMTYKGYPCFTKRKPSYEKLITSMNYPPFQEPSYNWYNQLCEPTLLFIKDGLPWKIHHGLWSWPLSCVNLRDVSMCLPDGPDDHQMLEWQYMNIFMTLSPDNHLEHHFFPKFWNRYLEHKKKHT